MAKPAMTRGELLKLLEKEARQYRLQALASIERSKHMNNLSDKDLAQLKKNRQLTQRMIDALLISFINAVGIGQGLDYGLYTKHLIALKLDMECPTDPHITPSPYTQYYGMIVS